MKRIIIAGGRGYLGTVLARYFRNTWEVVILSRKPMTSFDSEHNIRFVHWDGQTLGDWIKELDGAEVVINLAGKSVNCRYNEKNKQEIFDSRTNATTIIGEAIQLVATPPRLWINSSTATIYRHAEDKDMDELEGEIGNGFSVEVAKRWEQTFYDFDIKNIRKIALRTAIVLGKTEGVMLRLLNLVKFGLGGKNASGSQFVSWIHENDFCRAVSFLIEHEQLGGNVNLSSPNPITNDFLMKSIRKVKKISFGLPATKWMLKIGAFLLGTETELILKSRRVVPRRLLKGGFVFQYPNIEEALIEIIQ
jgi:uncharacterized protein